MPRPNTSFILTFSCQDRRGIVHAVSRFLSERHYNIVEAAQFTDHENQQFFMRVAFVMQGEKLGIDDLRQQFTELVAFEFEMLWELTDADVKMPVIIMVSKRGHCLHDLLLRWRTGLLPIDVRGIVSNHRDFYQLAASYDVPFHHIPVTPETKPVAEAELMKVFGAENAQLVILARYMQVLSDDLSRKLSGRAINIHHSFLPGFKGAKPYFQAHARGVKLIGATAHFLTGDLDEGPIIEQDVERADHSMSPAPFAGTPPHTIACRECLEVAHDTNPPFAIRRDDAHGSGPSDWAVRTGTRQWRHGLCAVVPLDCFC